MAFSNPVVGGETLVRAAMQSPNYQKGMAGWAINADGSAEFNGNMSVNGVASGPSATYDNITANKSLVYQGNELSALLAAVPAGYQWEGYNGAVPATAFTGSGAEITEISFIQQAGRSYKVDFYGAQAYVDTVGRVLTCMIATTDGSAPAVGSVASDSSFDYFPVTGNVYTTKPLSAEGIWGPAGSRIRVGIFIVKYDGGGGNYYTGSGNFTKPLRLTVADAGIQRSSGWTPGASTPKARYDTTYNFTAVQTYQNSGAKSIATNNTIYAYQGDGTAVGNPGGNQYGLFFFNSAQIRADLAGATIDATYIYLHNIHSYYNSGVQAVIGMHNYDPVPGGITVGSGGTVVGEGFQNVAEGGSFWTGDVTSWLGTALQNGSARGVILGAPAQADLAHYAYFDSCSIRVIYDK